MNSRHKLFLYQIAVAVASGILLRFVVDLHPIWWLVWVAPALLLLNAFRFSAREARWMTILAAAIGTSVNFHYLNLVMPLPAVIAVIAVQTLLWGFLILVTRRLVVRYQAWWTVFAFPVLSVALDTLMAALLPDGNFGSLAYSQGDILPILQITSLLGVSGLLFLITLVPSALAVAIAYGRSLRRGWIAYATTVVLLGSAILYGYIRLQSHVTGAETTFGMVSIDEAIGLRASAPYVSSILAEYDKSVTALAAQGAHVIVLPEKIAFIPPAKAPEWQQHFSALALENHVWLEVSVGIYDGKSPKNWAWLFSPDGAHAASYQKHYMAPPERHERYSAGTEYSVITIDGEAYGLAICKDMHFATFGRAYGERHAGVILVPAWDFNYLDGWMASRITTMRGIENGYTIVRASREGLLTVSDAYGRILAESRSSEMPGSSLLARVTVADPVPTLYTRIGNLFGWICVATAVAFLLVGRRQARGGSGLPLNR
jgi:apolipoprotein N-acyltransferase